MSNLLAEWRRCARFLAPALDGTHSLDNVWTGVAADEFHLWPGTRSAATAAFLEGEAEARGWGREGWRRAEMARRACLADGSTGTALANRR